MTARTPFLRLSIDLFPDRPVASIDTDSVAAARRQLRFILSRRAFVETGATATVAALGLAACSSPSTDGGTGGNGGSTTGPGLMQASGSIALPAGSTLSLATLMVDVAAVASAVSASGTFSAPIADTGPSLALLLDPAGHVVLMGLFDPANSASFTISSHSTATALLYFGFNAATLPPAAMSQVITLINNDPALTAVANTIATSVAAASDGLVSNASAISASLDTAVRTMLGVRSSLQHSAALAQSADSPTLMLINPTDAQGGITLTQEQSTPAIRIGNTKRRPARAYVYEVSTLTGQVTHDVNPAKRIAGVVELPATEAVSGVHSLEDIYALVHNPGSAPQTQWQPVTLDPITLALDGASDRTSFQVVVITAAMKSLAFDTFEPLIFRDAHFAGEIAEWRADGTALLFRSLLGDVVFPIVCLLGGLGAINGTKAQIGAVIDGIATQRAAAYARIIAQLPYGSVSGVSEAFAEVIQLALTSDVSTLFYRSDVQAVLGQAVAKATAMSTPAEMTARLTRAGQTFLSVLRPLLAVQGVLAAIDMGAVLTDLVGSDVAESWQVLLLKQLLNLKPVNPSINSGERVSFTVAKPANSNGNFIYVWTQTSLFAQLSAVGEVNVGSTITTPQLAVDLVTTGSDKAPITVTVVGYDTSSGQRVEIGRAATTVNFLLPAQITPSNPGLDIGEQKIFVVTVDGTLASGTSYKWTLTGTSGSIGSAPVVTTSAPQITYTGHDHGTDQLHVDVYDTGGVLRAKADVVILVAPETSVHFTLAAPWPSNLQHMRYGTFDFTGGLTFRSASGIAGLDYVSFGYNVDSSGAPGLGIIGVVPTGSALFSGQRFTGYSVTERPGAFTVIAAEDQNNIDLGQDIKGDSGLLVYDNVAKLSNGKTVVAFSFSIISDAGGSLIGKGIARLD